MRRLVDDGGTAPLCPRRGGLGRAPPSGVVLLLQHGGFPSILDARFAPAPFWAIAQAQRHHVFTEERRSAGDAVSPAYGPDHAGWMKVGVQDRFAAHAAIVRPRLRDQEPLPVTLRASRPRSLGYSRFSPLAAGTPLAVRLSRLCGRRWAALPPRLQPRWHRLSAHWPHTPLP